MSKIGKTLFLFQLLVSVAFVFVVKGAQFKSDAEQGNERVQKVGLQGKGENDAYVNGSSLQRDETTAEEDHDEDYWIDNLIETMLVDIEAPASSAMSDSSVSCHFNESSTCAVTNPSQGLYKEAIRRFLAFYSLPLPVDPSLRPAELFVVDTYGAFVFIENFLKFLAGPRFGYFNFEYDWPAILAGCPTERQRQMITAAYNNKPDRVGK